MDSDFRHGDADLPAIIYMVTAGRWEHKRLERNHPCLGKVLLFAAHGSVGFFYTYSETT